MLRRWRHRRRPQDWRPTTGAHECVKFEVSAKKVDLTDVVASIRVRYSSLDVDHADPAKSSTADGWGFAQIAFGVPDTTLTSTSMPRWSDGNPTKVP
jgi:hypothetical protein